MVDAVDTETRYLVKRAPGGLTGLKFRKQQTNKNSIIVISAQGPHTDCIWEKTALNYLPLHWPACLQLGFCHLNHHALRSSWNCSTNTIKAFPSPPSTSLPIRAAPFWITRTLPVGPIKLQELGVLVCMKKDQSGTRGRDLMLGFFWPWVCTLPFHRIFPFPVWTRNTEEDYPEQSRPYDCKLARSRAELPSWRGDVAIGLLKAVLYHSWTIPQWCCVTNGLFAPNKVSFTAPQVGYSFWCLVDFNDLQLDNA